MTELSTHPEANPFLRAIIEGSDFGILALDARGRIIVWNPWLADRTAVSKERALLTPLSEVMAGIPETTLAACADVLETGRSRILSPALHEILIPFTRPSRQTGRFYPIQNKRGEPGGLILFIHDLSPALDYERFISDEAAAARRDRENVFHAIGHPTFILDKEYRILAANHAAETVTGSSARELVGRKCHEILHGSDTPPPGCPFTKMLETGVLETQEMEVESLRGFFHVSCTPLFDEAGNLEKVIHIAMDITERKNTEAALRLSEERYRAFVKQSSEAICLFEIEHAPIDTSLGTDEQIDLLYAHAVIRECNQIFATRHGFDSPEEMFGFRIGQIFPRLAPENIEYLRRFIENGHQISEVESRELCKDGTVKSFLNSLTGQVENGQLIRIWGAKQDISRIKQAEDKFRSLIEGAPDAIMVQTQGLFAYVNAAAVKLFGASSPEELLGRPVLSRVHPDYHSAVRERIRLLNEEKSPVPIMEEKRLKLDGTPFLVEVSAVPFNYEDRDGALVFLRDITQRRLLEDQLRQAQKMESVGRLAGGMAHDFNNMLSVIIGYTGLALEKVAPEESLQEDLREIQKAAMRSVEVTRQLLAFARQQTISLRVIDLNETVEGMLKMLRRLIGEDIDLIWLPESGLWPVKMDPSQLDQILANLCVNARDAISGTGKITIETGTAMLDEAYCADHAGFVPGNYVLLTVCDDGCGMDKETLENLFEPFFTTKEVGQGTGLGLATVYGIVKQNEGIITVYSEPGKGTLFKIYLPRHEGKTGLMGREAPAEPDHRGHETILVVEDEPSILKMTAMMLERLGYTVLTAATPEASIRLAEAHPGEIHLLITDVVMPEMNGRELAKNILSLYPNLKHLFMSGYTADVIARHGVIDEGVNFIQKPFAMADLAAKVREVLAV